jgi:hypothetical protein
MAVLSRCATVRAVFERVAAALRRQVLGAAGYRVRAAAARRCENAHDRSALYEIAGADEAAGAEKEAEAVARERWARRRRRPPIRSAHDRDRVQRAFLLAHALRLRLCGARVGRVARSSPGAACLPARRWVVSDGYPLWIVTSVRADADVRALAALVGSVHAFEPGQARASRSHFGPVQLRPSPT